MIYKSPVYRIIAVPVEKIEPNTYNPNSVAPPELRLLYDSIKQDGYTMPVVCYYDKSRDKYTLVDGFHRYRIMLDYPDIYEREQGLLPVSIINKPLDQRMASTIRHNRARGTHNVDLMSNIIQELHELGRSDAWIETALLHQFRRGALLDHTAVPQHHDVVGSRHGAHPMGDDQHRLVPEQAGEGGLDSALVLYIQTGGGLIQQHHRRVLQ